MHIIFANDIWQYIQHEIIVYYVVETAKHRILKEQ